MFFVFNFLAINSFSQSGQKYATGLNNLSDDDKLGSKNYAPLNFYTNSIKRASFSKDGDFEVLEHARFRKNLGVDSLISALNLAVANQTKTLSLLVINNAQINGLLSVGPTLTFNGSNNTIFSSTGTINFLNNNLSSINTITANTISVNDAIISNSITDGTFLTSINEIRAHLDNAAKHRLIDDNSISDTTLWSSERINTEISNQPKSPWLADTNGIYPDTTLLNRTVIAPSVYANNLYAQNSLEIGTLNIKNGGNQPPGSTIDTISTPFNLAILSKARAIDLSADTLRMHKDGVKVVLDVNGTAYFRDLLWVKDGIIVGETFKGTKVKTDTAEVERAKAEKVISVDVATAKLEAEKIVSDTVATEKLETDSITALKMTADTLKAEREVKTKEATVTEKIKVGEANNVIIDGQHNRVYSTSGILDFNGNDFTNVGTITANTLSAENMNMSYSKFDSLRVKDRIKIGNSIIAEVDSTGAEPNHIYTSIGSGSLFLQSQFNNNQNTIINANNKGMVGIGTQNPVHKLHIFDSFNPLTNGHPAGIRIEDKNENTNQTSFWDILVYGGDFYLNNTANVFEKKFLITNDGKIGLGTTNPGDNYENPSSLKLDVNGDGRFYRGGNPNNYIRIAYNGAHAIIDSYGEDDTHKDLLINYYSGGDVVIGGGGGTKPATGNLITKYDTYLSTSNGKVGVGSNLPTTISSKLYVKGDGTTNQTSSFKVVNSNGNPMFVINDDGNVGIGTSNPQNALDVCGTIHSQLIKVDIDNWYDDVFEENYQLMSIESLNNFIKQNKHLPDMPSEKEIMNNGIDVGKINSILTKKVEELTLYIILQQQQIDELKARINELENNKRK